MSTSTTKVRRAQPVTQHNIRPVLTRSRAECEAELVLQTLERRKPGRIGWEWYPLRSPMHGADGSIKLGMFSMTKDVVVLTVDKTGALLASGKPTTVHLLTRWAYFTRPRL